MSTQPTTQDSASGKLAEHRDNSRGSSEEPDTSIRKLEIKQGILGKFFGSGQHVATNVGGTVVISLAVALVTLILLDVAIERIQLLIPLFTGALGYMFGKHRSKT